MRTTIFDRFPMVAVLAWRPHLAVALLLIGAALALPAPTRSAGLVLVGVAVLLGAPAAWRLRPERRPAPSPEDLGVLVLNVWHGRADTAALAALIERTAPDVVVLPEAGHDYCARIVARVAALGYDGVATTRAGIPDGLGVTVLTGPRAEDVRVRVGRVMRLPHAEVSGGPLGDRTLYAVHTTAPVQLGNVGRWRRDLRAAAGWAAAGGIVAGDVNATADHRLLRAVGRSAGPAGRGTWPTRLPRWAGIRIDHVLLPDGVAATAASVHDVPGSDHRAVEVRLRRP
ncbi:MAG: endonuclease/exonuclease/phosphatase family protein [Pseudonocardiales bacterium]|nr:endonuclease/exonuclease/phosphatase family protein [Pseudonocardiales bacterium]